MFLITGPEPTGSVKMELLTLNQKADIKKKEVGYMK